MKPPTVEERIAEINRLAAEQIERVKEEAARRAVRLEAQRRANEAARIKEAELRSRLELKYGMTGHPKRDLVWSKAYEAGHSNGFNEVEYWYDEFAEVAK